ncbi:hypothetical protein FHT78_005250 [Rhizobium sp. BK196]|uniref:hypothetical protein n=1 Tax=Rhizobium sp. BK196 TaxID=2587073 RepID=UPI00160C808E|nr:hypothetical protein [Rhizobium sp. BK196]MBB3313458.1 hypothetical protein [Rhizobium sp. BK196]
MKRIMRFNENRPIDFEQWTLTNETLATSVKVGISAESLSRRPASTTCRTFLSPTLPHQ